LAQPVIAQADQLHARVFGHHQSAKFIEQVLAYPEIDRLNIHPVSTMKISWDQPHEGNMFEFLWQRPSSEGW
jgi:hypothetical protein